jgi:hypothetical protein
MEMHQAEMAKCKQVLDVTLQEVEASCQQNQIHLLHCKIKYCNISRQWSCK